MEIKQERTESRKKMFAMQNFFQREKNKFKDEKIVNTVMNSVRDESGISK